MEATVKEVQATGGVMEASVKEVMEATVDEVGPQEE